MKTESIDQLNQIKEDALDKDDIKTVERVNGVLFEEGHITEILGYPRWKQGKEEVNHPRLKPMGLSLPDPHRR